MKQQGDDCKNCSYCKHYAELKEPRKFDGYAIYGYCFMRRGHQEKYPRGLPVYVPNGRCNDFTRAAHRPKPEIYGQMQMEGIT